ncbi:MAG: HD domain-containing protein [Lachnospiraceae bacterium]|nr:HD domain-containing protein [Lachnospiraceae bacterium]
MKEKTGTGINRKKQNMVSSLICAAGIALNLLLSAGVSALGLPLYLDTVGTVVVAATGGYLPGVFVGFVTNIFKSITDPSSLYYGILNVLIAIATAFLAERGYFRKLSGIIEMIIVFVLIGGGLGAFIPWFMEGVSYDSESLGGMLMQTGLFGPFVSHFLSSILLDLPDKAVTVAAAALILKLIPQKLYPYFSFNLWMQNPTKEEAENSQTAAGSGSRILSLRVKTLLVLFLSLMIVAVVGTLISGRIYHKAILNEHKELAKGTAKLAARSINGDRVDLYLNTGGITRDYYETKALLADILYTTDEIAYLYVYKMEEEGFRVIFDIDTEDTPAGELGDLLPYDEYFMPYKPQLLAGEDVEPIITDDEYGYLLTAAVPVYTSNGKCACYAIADVDMNRLVASEQNFLMEMITVFAGFFILICAFVIWLLDYHLIYPLRAMTTYVDDFSGTIDTQEETDQYVRKLRQLDIRTGDEIERLYRSVCDMTLSQAEQMRSIRQLSESTAKMQEGLIITMADMVENRDSDTGAHIQKTSAYVEIIAEGLKRKGYYPEKLTPQFMSDVVRSAPLHDVGKINIPDEVLNKPGKLTEEEYEIMKTHTVIGKKIMENAISSVKGENYLKEARNMAAYHHERWDGKGYPEGLHGEVIPLSARIMAVADVFDALSSARVYKPAFPLEKALAIIEEGSGTQFDPKCVEVFMESLTEVKVVLKKYNQDV